MIFSIVKDKYGNQNLPQLYHKLSLLWFWLVACCHQLLQPAKSLLTTLVVGAGKNDKNTICYYNVKKSSDCMTQVYIISNGS